MLRTLLVLALAFGCTGLCAQASLTSSAATYNQNFDSLANSGTSNTWSDNTTLSGWYAYRARVENTVASPPITALYTGATSYRADTGAGNTGTLYSFGSAASTERALGSIGSNSYGDSLWGVRLKNTDATQTIVSLSITYTGEQWREAGASTGFTSTQQNVDFAWQLGATDIFYGTWTNEAALQFLGPIFGSQPSFALDGNLAANRVTLSTTITVAVAPGTEIWLRWTDINHGFNDHALAIDDLSVTATYSATPAVPVIRSINASTGLAASTTAVTIKGFNLQGATSVQFGASAATGVTVVDSETITCTAPTGPVGPADVTVTTPGGVVTATRGFVYQPAGAVLSTGDIRVLGFKCSNTKAMAFVTWASLPIGTRISFTDATWSSPSGPLAQNEKLWTWVNNTAGAIAAGTVIVITENSAGTIGLADLGGIEDGEPSDLFGTSDNIFAFQGSNLGPRLLNAVLFSQTTWLTQGPADLTRSYLPSALAAQNLYLNTMESYGEYTGSRTNQAAVANYMPLVAASANYTLAPATSAALDSTDFTAMGMPTLTVSATGTPAEGGATATYVISASPAPGSSLTFNFSMSGVASFAAGGDYSLTGNATFSIVSGQGTAVVPTSGSVTITLTVNDDALVEGSEAAILTIDAGAGYAVGAPATANLDIADNDSPTVNIVSSGSPGEGGTSATFTISASPLPASPLTVNISLTGTATFGAANDYSVSGATITTAQGGSGPWVGTLVIPTTGSVNITIAPIDDSAVESTETVVATLAAGSGYNVGAPSSASLNLADNEINAVPTITVSSSSGPVSQWRRDQRDPHVATRGAVTGDRGQRFQRPARHAYGRGQQRHDARHQ